MKKTTRMFLILFALLTLTVSAIAHANIDPSEAEDLALQVAGITGDQATLLNTKAEREDGIETYDVEFNANGLEYEFHLSVSDGTMLSSKWEADDTKMLEMAQSQSSDSVWIGKAQALTNALADASLTAADVTVTESKFDTDDLLKVYEISFFTADAEYEYEINALSGEICAKSMEYRSDAQATEKKSGKKAEEKSEKKAGKDSGKSQSTDKTSAGESSSYIGVDRAKSIALNHAGLSESKVKFSKAKLEKDDGKRIYEIEFHVGNTEYEYEIDAKTGDILDYDKEYDDD